MTRNSVQAIMEAIGGSTIQDPTMPTAGGTEWKLWLSFINRSINEWSQAYDWEDLRAEFPPAISGLTQATIALPQNFGKLAAAPIHYGTGVAGGEEWPEILPEQQKLFSTETKWSQIRGDINNGFNLIWNPGTLASGASLIIQYFSIPTSLASPAQIPLVPDSQFIVDRVIAYIWEARTDSRFQEQEVKARERLLQMIDNANVAKYSSYANPNYILSQSHKSGFRFGRD